MSTSTLSVLTDLSRGVLTITFNRPKVNAINAEMIQALQQVLREAGWNPEARVILLAARGSVFSAGQDIAEIKQAQGSSFRYHLLRTYNPLILQIRQLEKPVLVAINGPVSGAALGIALACDLRIAADTARFVVGFVGVGLAPDSGVSLLLPALIGLGRASEYAYTNAPIDAQRALELGLVNHVVPAEELESQAIALATALAQGPVHAMGLAKRAFNKAILPNLEQVLDYEAHLQDIAAKGDEHTQGLQAFLEKRPPDFYTFK